MPDDRLDQVRDVLDDVLDRTDAPVATAPEVADALDRERRRVFDDLRALERAGEVDSKAAGARGRVWWPTRHPPGRERAQDRPASAGDARPTDAPERERDADEGGQEREDDLRALAETVDLPGRGDRLDQRRDALAAVLRYLRESGEAHRSDFQRDVYPEYPAEYETPDGWWNAIQPALAELAEADDRLRAAGTRAPWQWLSS